MKIKELELSGMEILIVDDVPANIDVLRKTLEAAGYKILFAPNGKIGLKVAALSKPALILLDIMMPEMDGFETCEKLKANPETCDIPALFLSAKNETEDIVKGFKLGAMDYITKPFRQDEVCARVKTHLTIVQQHKNLVLAHKQLELKNENLQKMIKFKDTFLKSALRDLQDPEKSKGVIEKLANLQKLGVDLFPSEKRLLSFVSIEAIVEGNGNKGFVFAVNEDGSTVSKMPVSVVKILESEIALNPTLTGFKRVVTDGSSYLTDGAEIVILGQ